MVDEVFHVRYLCHDHASSHGHRVEMVEGKVYCSQRVHTAGFYDHSLLDNIPLGLSGQHHDMQLLCSQLVERAFLHQGNDDTDHFVHALCLEQNYTHPPHSVLLGCLHSDHSDHTGDLNHSTGVHMVGCDDQMGDNSDGCHVVAAVCIHVSILPWTLYEHYVAVQNPHTGDDQVVRSAEDWAENRVAARGIACIAVH